MTDVVTVGVTVFVGVIVGVIVGVTVLVGVIDGVGGGEVEVTVGVGVVVGVFVGVVVTVGVGVYPEEGVTVLVLVKLPVLGFCLVLDNHKDLYKFLLVLELLLE